MNEKISVIIPVINEEKKIESCLLAVFNQSIRPHEVIVVDGNSKDKTVENALKYPIKLYFEDYHTRAGANNVAINNVSGDFVAFTDADCIPHYDWLENLVKEFTDEIIGVGGCILNIGNNLWESSINLTYNSFLGSARSIQGRVFPEKKFVKSISGCNSMYRLKDLETIGGFNVNLHTAEDTDLNNRLQPYGKLLYTPYSIVEHNHQRGLKNFCKRMFQYGRGRAKCKLVDVQIIPPIIAPFILLSLIKGTMILMSLLAIYLLAIFSMGFYFSLKAKNYRYFFTIPVVYMCEHLCYSIGFWRGIFEHV